MNEKDSKPTIGLIVGNREFFPTELSVKGGKEVISTLKDEGFDVVTKFSEEGEGLADNREDSKEYAELFNGEDIDGILITLPNFGDEKSIQEALKLTEAEVPVMVHAFPDKIEKMDRKNRRDSFCGKISICNNLYQAGIPFTNTEKHVESPNSDEFERDMERFRKVCQTVSGVKGSRLGVVGLRPNAFQTVRYSEKILESNGISVETISLIKTIETLREMDDEDQKVRDKIDKIREKFVLEDIPQEDVTKTAKLNVFLSEWVRENDLDTLAFQCWPEIEDYYNIAPCGALSILSEEMIPGACESDVLGSLSMYALTLAADRPAALLDINNNYGKNPNKLTAFHCSNFPRSFFEENECELGYHDMQNKYGSCSGQIAPGPVTFFRLSTDDPKGKIKGYVAEGQFTDDEVETFGGYGVAKIERMQDLLDHIVNEGFEHHTAAVHGHVADVIEESLENYLGWEIYRHSP